MYEITVEILCKVSIGNAASSPFTNNCGTFKAGYVESCPSRKHKTKGKQHKQGASLNPEGPIRL
jgi:hypothetical protein